MKKFLLSIALILASCASIFAADNKAVYDGNWWRSTDHDQHIGFLVGYIDCYAYERKGPLLFEESWYQYENRITKFFQDHPAESGKSVVQALETVAPQKGKIATEKHLFFDGEYWRQSVPTQRLGYVQGFFQCYRNTATRKTSFSKPDEWYVSQISKWFGVKEDDPSEINEKRVNIKIGDVLFKFKDAAPKKPASSKPDAK